MLCSTKHIIKTNFTCFFILCRAWLLGHLNCIWDARYISSGQHGLDVSDLLGEEGYVLERQVLICHEHIYVPHTRILSFSHSNECIE